MSSASALEHIRLDEAEIDELFGWASPDLPGAAVGISINGEPVYRKGFGSTGLAPAQRLSANTPMRVGSVTKQFACLTYGLLCELGRATLDDEIGQHLPEIDLASRRATMRQLMGNTSGLRDALDLNWHSAGAARVSSEELLSLYRDINDVNAPADATWIYNNGGFLMLSAAIERLTSQTLEDALRAFIFDPLQMGNTRLQRQDESGDDHAHLHMLDESGDFSEAHIGTALAGEGGLISSVDDLLKWSAEMDRQQIGSPRLWGEMMTSQILSNGTQTGYGFGLMRGKFRGFDTIYHPGGLLGGSAQLMKVQDLGLDVIVISNRSDVSAIDVAQKILDAVDGNTAELDEPSLPLIDGVYRSEHTGRVIELYVADGVQFGFLDGTPMQMEGCVGGRLRPGGVYGYLRQTLEIDHDKGRLTFVDFGNLDILHTVSRDARIEDRQKHTGVYKATSAPLAAKIEEGPAGYRLSVQGPYGSSDYGLERLVENVWKLKPAQGSPWGGLICFGNSGFHFSNGYFTRRLEYRRAR